MQEITVIEYAVQVGEETHWFDSYINAFDFARNNKSDLIQKIEYSNGEKHYINQGTNEKKVF